MTRLLRFLVQVYRNTIGIALPNSCCYHPTCSQYGLDALSEYGAFRGAWLTLKRIARCHPWAAGGYDPVPENDDCRVPRRQTGAAEANDECRTSDLATERRTTGA